MTEKDPSIIPGIEKPASPPFWGRLMQPAIYLAIIILLGVIPLFLDSPYVLHVLILVFIYVVATVSLRSITISGQYPLAHAAFMGIGAYVSAVISKNLGWSLWLTIPLGGVMAMIVGVFIGYPFARLRAFYYAMVSMFFGLGVYNLIIVLTDWTSGAGGLVGITHLLSSNSKVPYYYFILGFMVICLLALWRFENSRIGLNLKAIAQSHLVASSVGINEVWYRVMALGVGCFFAGIAGAIYAHYNFTLSPTSFDLMAGLWLFIYALIGGLGNFNGPIIGTALLILVQYLANALKAFVPFISAAILIIVFYVMHDGLVGLPRIIMSLFSRNKPGGRRGTIEPAQS